jgi:hypothetical protein
LYFLSASSRALRIGGQGKFAVVISMLNAYLLGSDLSQLDEWYKRGVRVLGYTHAGHNDWADSSRPSAALKESFAPLADRCPRDAKPLGHLAVAQSVTAAEHNAGAHREGLPGLRAARQHGQLLLLLGGHVDKAVLGAKNGRRRM